MAETRSRLTAELSSQACRRAYVPIPIPISRDVGGISDVSVSRSKVTDRLKLQALVYDILPSTTAVFSYAIGSRKLSANEQFFVVVVVGGGAQTVVSLLQTTQIKQGVSFIAANKSLH